MFGEFIYYFERSFQSSWDGIQSNRLSCFSFMLTTISSGTEFLGLDMWPGDAS